MAETALDAIGSDDSTDRSHLLSILAVEVAKSPSAPAGESIRLAEKALDMARRVADPAVTTVLNRYNAVTGCRTSSNSA